jgi:UDP-galactopyranose mutase
VSYNHEPNSYVQNGDSRQKYRVKEELKKHNIFVLPRFEEWKYYNMDKCMKAAMSLQKEMMANPNG